MKERKNIDRLYQEKFKDFEATPREAVWKNIAEKLEEKNRKKPAILPLWYKLGGVAAALAVIFGLTYFLNTGNSGSPQVVFEIDENTVPEIELPSENEILKETEKTLDGIAAEEAGDSQNETSNNSGISSEFDQKANAVAENSSESNNSAAKKASDSKAALEENKSTLKTSENKSEEAIASAQEKKGGKKSSEKTNFINPDEDKSPESVIAAEETSEKTTEDHLISEENNELALLENEKEKDPKVAGENRRLQLSTFAAPIFYDNMGSGNAIDPQFAANATQAEVTMSYGIKVAYNLSEKLKIRSGVNKVAMSYNIQDISYSNGLAAASTFASGDRLENIHFAPGSQGINISSGTLDQAHNEIQGLTQIAGASMEMPGNLNQSFGFIEVPLEIEYALIDKKFGLNLIGGGSSFFLDENKISLEAENTETTLGKANNLNRLSFSTNIGLGLDYELSEQFQLNLEPTFKYQLNTFSNTENVQPYFFGIYSGVSFKF